MNATPQDLAFIKSSVPLFADFSDAERAELANGSRIEVLSSGDIIVQAGDKAHALGIILEGKIAALAGESQRLGELGAGETFGEMALMTGDPAVADLIAEERSRVMLVPLTSSPISHHDSTPRAPAGFAHNH